MGYGAEVIPLIGEPLTEGWPSEDLDLAEVQVDRSKYPALQQNAAQVKGKHRVLPKPLVVKVAMNGHSGLVMLKARPEAASRAKPCQGSRRPGKPLEAVEDGLDGLRP